MLAVVSSLHHFELPLIIVDDGSELTTKTALWLPCRESSANVTFGDAWAEPRQRRCCKGRYQKAQQLGFSHAIQIDADGQHDLEALPALLQASQDKPQRLISGQPVWRRERT